VDYTGCLLLVDSDNLGFSKLENPVLVVLLSFTRVRKGEVMKP
jgi:hypothetical protein